MTYVPTERQPTGIPAAPLIRPCGIADCPRPHMALGYCRIHYDRHRRGTDMHAPVRPTERTGVCRACDRPSMAKSALCAIHANVQYRYGITPERLDELLAAQGGACAACGDPLAEFGRLVAIDHDHRCCDGRGRTCGRCVRGIVCCWCNKALGHALDSVERLNALIAYLNRWEETRAVHPN